MKTLSILAAALLAGCTGMGAQNMSAEQISASAKAKDANVVCVVGTGPWGKAATVYLNVDKSVVMNGSVSVDAECKTTFTNAKDKP